MCLRKPTDSAPCYLNISLTPSRSDREGKRTAAWHGRAHPGKKTLAKMASRGMKSAGVAMPVDEALCELALWDAEDLAAATRLGPIGVRKQRKRSRSDA